MRWRRNWLENRRQPLADRKRVQYVSQFLNDIPCHCVIDIDGKSDPPISLFKSAFAEHAHDPWNSPQIGFQFGKFIHTMAPVLRAISYRLDELGQSAVISNAPAVQAEPT